MAYHDADLGTVLQAVVDRLIAAAGLTAANCQMAFHRGEGPMPQPGTAVNVFILVYPGEGQFSEPLLDGGGPKQVSEATTIMVEWHTALALDKTGTDKQFLTHSGRGVGTWGKKILKALTGQMLSGTYTAPAVPQIDVFEVSAYSAATSYRVTIGATTVSVSGTGGTTATTAAALQAALAASLDPGFAAITWTVVENRVIGTGAAAGTAFTATSSVSGGTGTMGHSTLQAGAAASTGTFDLLRQPLLPANRSMPERGDELLGNMVIGFTCLFDWDLG